MATIPLAEEGCTYAAAVLDLNAGTHQLWPLEPRWADAYGICSVAWAADGERLVVDVCVESVAVLHLVELNRPGTIGESTFLGPKDSPRSWSRPATGAGEEVAIVEYRFETDPMPAEATIAMVEARPGSEPRGLLQLDGHAVSIQDIHVDVDVGGRELIYVTLGSAPDGSPHWQLYRWDGTSVTELRDGIVAAAAW